MMKNSKAKIWRLSKIGGPMRPHSSYSAKVGIAIVTHIRHWAVTDTDGWMDAL